MRIISLVPSWTETLIESGIYPVGRTRFCIHPKAEVEKIPVVGGTKTVNWDLVRELKPDLLILDQEENPKDFSQQGIPFWSSQITNGRDLEKSLNELSDLLQNAKLKKWAEVAAQINNATAPASILSNAGGAILDVVKHWKVLKPIAYVIWKNPWMAVSRETYIGFVLEKLGYKVHFWSHSRSKYPEFNFDGDADVIYFFSSEPYPFLKIKDQLAKMDVSAALVDGEKFSWFGIRSLRFLQKALQLSNQK